MRPNRSRSGDIVSVDAGPCNLLKRGWRRTCPKKIFIWKAMRSFYIKARWPQASLSLKSGIISTQLLNGLLKPTPFEKWVKGRCTGLPTKHFWSKMQSNLSPLIYEAWSHITRSHHHHHHHHYFSPHQRANKTVIIIFSYNCKYPSGFCFLV